MCLISLIWNLLIRSFILVKSNTFRLTKFSKKRIAFNIFIPIPVQEMIYVKSIQKITPMDVSVSGTIDLKTYLKKFRGGCRHLAPPGSAFANSFEHVLKLSLVNILRHKPQTAFFRLKKIIIAWIICGSKMSCSFRVVWQKKTIMDFHQSYCMWHSDNVYLHWLILLPLCFHLF